MQVTFVWFYANQNKTKVAVLELVNQQKCEIYNHTLNNYCQ